MKCLEALEREAKALGAEVELQDSGSNAYVLVDAPPGKVWKANDCHVIQVQTENGGGQRWWAQALKELTAEIKLGLRDCELKATGNCDTCNDL